MRLLIVTQKVDQDDSYFGFFHDWIAEFAKTCETVTVITLERRRYTLPANVTILSLGKERGSWRVTRLLLFWKYVWQERASYDAVFCHMSPLYVLAGYPLWKATGKRIGLWYSHRHVDVKLRIAAALADTVLSTTPHAFRLKTSKVRFFGHAIDAEAFVRPAGVPEPQIPTAVVVGRITPIKHIEIFIRAIGVLSRRNMHMKGIIIGAPLLPADHDYARELEELVEKEGISDAVIFTGSIPFERIRESYWRSTVSVNLAPTGGMDKVVLEAAASGIPVIVSNAAFAQLLEGYEDRLIFKENDAEDLADKMSSLLQAPDKEMIGRTLQERVEHAYSLKVLIPRILQAL